MYIYFFSFLNFNPQNIPAKNGGRLGWVSFNGHLLPRSAVYLPHTEATPSPHPPAQPRMAGDRRGGRRLKEGPGSSALG